MKRTLISILILSSSFFLNAQNIGILTNASRFPIGFSTATGQKISFYDNGNSGFNNYGMGIQSGLLQIHADSSDHDIAFGYGSSNSFIENFRFKGNGNMGVGVSDPEFPLDVKGKIRIRNQGINSAGFWMNNSLNNASPAFIGLQNDTTVGFYGASAGWSMVMNINTGFVGIKNSTPKSPLSFPPTLGKKISLYSTPNGDDGFAVAGNRLQIFSENPNAGVAFGYNQYHYFPQFINLFEVKNNGALALSGDAGSQGQYLMSNGANAPASWKYINHYKPEIIYTTQQLIVSDNAGYTIPGMVKDFNTYAYTYFRVDFEIEAESIACTGCPPSVLAIRDRCNNTSMVYSYYIYNGQKTVLKGSKIFGSLGLNGPDDVRLEIYLVSGPPIKVGSDNTGTNKSFMIVERLD
jgi:hypothetical protein